MKFSLAVQLLSPAFSAIVASSSSVSVAETLALANKKDDNHRDMNAAAAAAASLASRNLESTHTTSTSSKSSKASVSCPPEPTPDVQCGSTYVDSTVILGQNLICTEGRDGSFVALTLKGKKALIDCQGYTISQNTNSSSAAMDDTEDLFFDFGVVVTEGATMVNCNIQKFKTGAGLFNGGVIKDSEFSLNFRGVEVEIVNLPDAPTTTTNTVSKVANR